MFAIIINGTIARFADTCPVPEEGETIDCREVIDGSKPAPLTTFSTVVERPVSEWTITPTQVVRTWLDHLPPMSDCRAIAVARKAIEHKTAMDTGITVSGVTLSGDDASVTKMTSKAVMLDLALRNGSISPPSQVTVYDVNGVAVNLPAKDMLALLCQFGAAHEAAFQARKAKKLAIAAATTLEQLTAIP